MNIAGGSIGDEFDARHIRHRSMVTISGGGFRIDGTVVAGLDTPGNMVGVDLPFGAVLSGTLQDGTPFAFSSLDSDYFPRGNLTLAAVELPPVGPAEIMVPVDPAPLGIRSGQTLTVSEGGMLGSQFQSGRGSVVEVTGGEVGEDFEAVGATVNISGGTVGRNFDAFFDSTVNISGGTIRDEFEAHRGSTVNISGGSVDGRFRANHGSSVTISGGSVGRDFQAYADSTVDITGGSIADGFKSYWGMVTISGGDFRLDGTVVAGLDAPGNMVGVDLPVGAVLSGTLQDGTPFAFSSQDSDVFTSGTLTLVAAELPPVGPTEIMVPTDTAPLGIRSGQALTVSEGGAVGDQFQAGWGSVVEVTGGEVGENLEAVGATVNISGGSVDSFDAFFGSTVNISGGMVINVDAHSGSLLNISGGSVGIGLPTRAASLGNIPGSLVQARAGSLVNISGGIVGNFFGAHDGSTVNISGGIIGRHFDAEDGSIVNITGGVFGDRFETYTGSAVTISGGDFRLSGSAVAGLDTPGSMVGFDLPDGAVLSGTLQDGTPFAFSSLDADSFASGTVTLVATELPPVGPAEIMVPADSAPLGIRNGQTLTVSDGGVVGDQFQAGRGSVIEISGGEVGDYFEAVGATVNISGGTVDNYFDAFLGSTVNISGGSVGFRFRASGNTVVNISGGTIGDEFDAHSGSIVNISGGTVNQIDANNGSVLTISGGTIGLVDANEGSALTISGGLIDRDVDAFSGSTVNLFGTQFLLDGSDITASLTPSVPFTIADRDVTLSGLFMDGSPFSFDLNSVNETGEDYVDPDAVLTVTLVLPGDFNGDGLVDAADYTVWRDALGSTVSPGTSADANFDGVVDHSDRLVWRANFGDSTADGAAANTIPEPATLVLLLLVCCLLPRHRKIEIGI